MYDFRPAHPDETQPALRIILGHNGQLADNNEVLSFLRLTVKRHIDLGQLWLATDQSQQIITAALPIVSPGRTVQLMLPTAAPATAGQPQALDKLIQRLCCHYRNQGIILAQGLVDPDNKRLIECLSCCSFSKVAELIYLRHSSPQTYQRYQLPPGLQAIHYSPQNHNLFAATVLASYENTLDCPAMDGIRPIDDVLAGHKAVGPFDPQLWTLLMDGQQAVGVALISRLYDGNAGELVYIGLPAPARGRGLGHVLLQYALGQLARAGMKQMLLAVDSINTPALRLYEHHQFDTFGQKLVLMRHLAVEKPTDTCVS